MRRDCNFSELPSWVCVRNTVPNICCSSDPRRYWEKMLGIQEGDRELCSEDYLVIFVLCNQVRSLYTEAGNSLRARAPNTGSLEEHSSLWFACANSMGILVFNWFTGINVKCTKICIAKYSCSRCWVYKNFPCFMSYKTTKILWDQILWGFLKDQFKTVFLICERKIIVCSF